MSLAVNQSDCRLARLARLGLTRGAGRVLFRDAEAVGGEELAYNGGTTKEKDDWSKKCGGEKRGG